MLFNSLHYAFFLPLVVMGYFAFPARLRWMLLLAASYYFYMCWRPAYAVLIVTSTTVDFAMARTMAGTDRPGLRRGLLATSLIVNLGLLFFFKYYNLFAFTTNEMLGWTETPAAVPALDLLLPVGISFYTFQSLSYTIDVFRRQRPPERHFGYYALYVSFFPQLVAGPIERSDHLLPQLKTPQRFQPENIEDGLKLLLWGYFKKLVIADRLALYVNHVYGHSDAASSGQLVLATYLFAFQIYCDFSGYSDIATGSAQLMGYRFRANFRQPYLSANIREFWSRWHISLSTWFRDYVYLPLGGSHCSLKLWIRNIMVVFLLSGLWHGANWTFVVWGGLHAGYYLIHRLYSWCRPRRIGEPRGWFARGMSVIVTFHAVLLAWVFFRAGSVGQAGQILRRIATEGWRMTQGVQIPGFGSYELGVGLAAICLLLAVERFGAEDFRGLLQHRPQPVRWAFYYAVVLAVLNLGMFNNPQQFIYFQF